MTYSHEEPVSSRTASFSAVQSGLLTSSDEARNVSPRSSWLNKMLILSILVLVVTLLETVAMEFLFSFIAAMLVGLVCAPVVLSELFLISPVSWLLRGEAILSIIMFSSPALALLQLMPGAISLIAVGLLIVLLLLAALFSAMWQKSLPQVSHSSRVLLFAGLSFGLICIAALIVNKIIKGITGGSYSNQYSAESMISILCMFFLAPVAFIINVVTMVKGYDAKDPTRTVPLAMSIILIVVTVLFFF